MFSYLVKQKTFKMAWSVESGEKANCIAGSAHFFPYSFKNSLKRLITGFDTVLLEGPLDESDMDRVRSHGVKGNSMAGPSLYDSLDKDTIRKMNRELEEHTPGADSPLVSYLNLLKSEKKDLFFSEIEGLQPWMAFFKIWSNYLKKRGWKYSVDLEAYAIAKELDKKINFLETIDEQIHALNGIPFERIVNFFKQIDKWEHYARKHAEYYLSGNFDLLYNLITEFPTRWESIIDKRDPVLFERMEHFFQKGKAIAFVGTTHIRGITKMLEETGYNVEKQSDVKGSWFMSKTEGIEH